MDFRLQILLFITSVFSKTHELRVSTTIQNPEVLPVVGENITLSCTFTPPSIVSLLRLLYWKNGNNVILASEKCIRQTCEKNVPNDFKFSLVTDSSGGNLTVMDLRLDDNDTYRCEVITSGNESSNELSLAVMLPAAPGKISITDELSTDKYNDADLVSMTSGKAHNLTCSVPEARPPAILEWQTNDEVPILQEEQYNAVDGYAYVSRRVVSITPSRVDDGKTLRCVVSHQKLKSELQSSIRFDVQVPPSNLSLTASGSLISKATGTRSVIVFEDSPTSFTCRSVGSFPRAEIRWFIGPEEDLDTLHCTTTKNEVNPDLRDTSCTLQFIPKRRHHYQVLKCVAKAGINQRQVGVILNVHGPPESPYLNGTHYLEDGVSATVTCTSNNGYPPPIFQWNFGSQKNVTSSSTNLSSTNENDRVEALSHFTFTPTASDHGKRIECEVFQPTSPPKKSGHVSEVINVFYSPVIVNYSVRRIPNGHQSVNAIFTCTSDGRPLPSLVWFRNGTELTNSTRYQIHYNVSQEGETFMWSKLIISNIQKENEGSYICLAKSRIGNDSNTFIFTSFGSPDPPSWFIVDQIRTTYSTLFFAWKPRISGGEQQSFTLQYPRYGT